MKKLILIFILSLLPSLALAQTSRNPCFINTTGGCTPVSTANPLPVDATVNASVTGFEPAATGTPISVTTGGNTGTLPAGDVVAVFNVGTTNTAYCKLGASSTTSDIAIPPASWFAFTVGAATQLTCITSTSTTTVNMVGGTGLPTGSGGGGSITQGNAGSNAQAWWVRIGDTSAGPAKVQAGNVATTTDVALTVADPNVLAAINSSIPAGTNLIGDVNLRQGGTVLSATNPTFTRLTDGTNAAVLGPCQTVARTAVPISQTASTKLINATSAKKTYICSLALIVADAENISLMEGTGSTCGSATQSALIGGITAATGMNFAANGGLTMAGGPYIIAQGTTANHDVCLLQSGSGRVSGVLTYVQQ